MAGKRTKLLLGDAEGARLLQRLRVVADLRDRERRPVVLWALSGLQRPVLRAQAERLAARGKPGKVRVAAVMRKLLGLGLAVLRSQQPWNPAGRLLPKSATPPS